MIAARAFQDRDVAVFGLGGSGLVSARALMAGGARVAAWDDSAASRAKAAEAGVPLADLKAADWSRFAGLVLAPGVPLTHPAPHWSAALARAAGVEIIGDIELFCRERARLAPLSPFSAITGTNGKSTVTALLAHLLTALGHKVGMGGNIGTPVLELPPPDGVTAHVVECSSFQIDLAPSLNPSAGILMNITPDHLDRHGDFAHYASVKERLVMQADIAIIGADDAPCREIAARLVSRSRKTLTFSDDASRVQDGVLIVGARLLRVNDGVARPLTDLTRIASLRGRHNFQNAAAAVLALGEEADDLPRLAAALRSFPGLAHRMEEVGRIGGLIFVNDSKATNADAADKALASFDNIYWIAGGRAKEGGIEELRPHFSKIRMAYLIGEAAEDFSRTLGGGAPWRDCGTLERAVEAAARDAAAAHLSGAVVLLSPACASYDQFRNFELRGDAFRALARDIIAKHPAT